LEQRGEVGPFLQSCQALVDKSIEVYLRRGFTNLSVYFGCTGGQHRSVYCAEHLAQYINQKYDVDVRLEHREQNIVELLAGSQTNLNK
jgi:RNase adaptor protein for sRNA GlmZ degradation